MKITLNTALLHTNLEKIAKKLSATYQHDQNMSLLKFASPTGEGTIKALNFTNLSTLIVLDFKLSFPLTLHYISKEQYHPLKLIYSFLNSFRHVVYNHQIDYLLKADTASLSAGHGEFRHQYVFTKDTPYRIAIIEMNREGYLDRMDIVAEDLPKTLKEIFLTGSGQPFFFLFQHHYRLKDGFDELINIDALSLTDKMYAEAKVLEITSYMLKLFEDQHFHRKTSESFTAYDLNQLNTARLFLKENYKNPPTIKKLAKKVAINENKLKKGFKELFEITVYKYTISQKMKQARKLFDDNLNISIAEVAEEVGYANHSQFSKRFLQYFGLLPKAYQKAQKL